MAIYMKMGSIVGSVTTSGYEQWIELKSFAWRFSAVERHGSSLKGSEVTVGEVSVTLLAEKASPLIVSAGVNRTILSPVSFKFTTTSAGKVDTFLAYDLSGCMITNYTIQAGAEGHPIESLELNFTKITETYTSRDAKMTGTPSSVTYDVRGAQTS